MTAYLMHAFESSPRAREEACPATGSGSNSPSRRSAEHLRVLPELQDVIVAAAHGHLEGIPESALPYHIVS